MSRVDLVKIVTFHVLINVWSSNSKANICFGVADCLSSKQQSGGLLIYQATTEGIFNSQYIKQMDYVLIN